MRIEWVLFSRYGLRTPRRCLFGGIERRIEEHKEVVPPQMPRRWLVNRPCSRRSFAWRSPLACGLIAPTRKARAGGWP